MTDREQLTALKEVWPGARHIPGAAAAIVLVLPVPEEERMRTLDQFDLGQAVAQMLIVATDLGVGTGHASIGDQDELRRIIGLPDTHYGAYMFGLGYPADRPLRPIEKPDRRPFDEVVHRDTW